MTGEREVASLIREAVKLHGHLGPFLVIGVRMGSFAEKTLSLGVVGKMELRVSVKIPFFTPFSCALDGIQVTTNCTIGNQKLKVEKSKKKITGCFKLQDSDRTLRISVNPRVVKELVNEMSKGVTNEELANRIVSMSEQQLFVFGKQQVFVDLWRLGKVEMQMQDLEIARERLSEKHLTLCIAKDGDVIFETRSHGISGFLKAVEEFEDRLMGASVADRVVGKAIALLCVYASVSRVYASTLSWKAKELLEENDIYVEYDVLVENVLGADKATMCPFENLAAETTDPRDAYRKLKALHYSLRERR